MSSFLNTIKCKFILALISTSPIFVFASDNIGIESMIIFNTSCARCHEGECSGRLSFHLPKSAANQHIRRHGGDLSLETVEQLFRLLCYMKEECSFYPFSLTLIDERIWDGDTLAQFHTQSKKAYFIPLGHMEPGLYQLLYEGLNDISNICVEIINNQFDFFEKEYISAEGEKKGLQFYVDERSDYFLRIKADKAINLNQLELVPKQINNE